jgi:hypothetical protein
VLLHEARLAVHFRLGLDGDALIREAPSDGSPAGRSYQCAAPRPAK